MPAFNVIVELGQVPQAPCNCNFTIPSSTSTNVQSPPSRNKMDVNVQ